MNTQVSLWSIRARTLYRIGLRNVFQVALYRVLLRLGMHPVQSVRRKMSGSRFFRPPAVSSEQAAPRRWDQYATYFGWYELPSMGNPPDWFTNPFTESRIRAAEAPWWQLSDFDHGAGDIKTIWEASRFDWVVAFAQQGLTVLPLSLTN